MGNGDCRKVNRIWVRVVKTVQPGSEYGGKALERVLEGHAVWAVTSSERGPRLEKLGELVSG